MNNFVKIDLQEHFNHKLIGDATIINAEKEISNMSIDGEFFYPDLLPNSLEEILIDGVPYTFPEKSPEKYDNITFDEQLICVPENYYKYIFFLGASEWGDHKETVRINFVDCTYNDIEVYFIDLGKNQTKWEYDLEPSTDYGFALPVTTTSSYKWGIYYYKCKLECTHKLINSVSLPYNPCIHIFAITLEKK